MALAPLPVQGRGDQATITKSILQIEDLDNPADILFMVLEPPRHGRLTRLHSERALSRFKLEELSQEQIQYIHDGSAGTEDAMMLQVNDGHSYKNVLLLVHISQRVRGHDGRFSDELMGLSCRSELLLCFYSFLSSCGKFLNLSPGSRTATENAFLCIMGLKWDNCKALCTGDLL